MYVTQDDIDVIRGLNGIRYVMCATNRYDSSGPLTLRKPTPGENLYYFFKNSSGKDLFFIIFNS